MSNASQRRCVTQHGGKPTGTPTFLSFPSLSLYSISPFFQFSTIATAAREHLPMNLETPRHWEVHLCQSSVSPYQFTLLFRFVGVVVQRHLHGCLMLG